MNTPRQARDSFYRILGMGTLAIVCVAAFAPTDGQRGAAPSNAVVQPAAAMGPVAQVAVPARVAAVSQESMTTQ